MALQQQCEPTTASATEAASKTESTLVAFWREVIVENPVYQREVGTVAVPVTCPPEKAEALREKHRKNRADWGKLPLWQKSWRTLRPYLITFAIVYALVPLWLTYLSHGSGGFIGPLIGPLIGGMFGASVMTTAAITGEREKRTWNALLLSRLTPQQLIGGKVASILRTLLMGSGILIPIALAFVVRGLLPPATLLLIPLVLLPNLLLTTLVGVRTSLWSKNSQEAQKKTMWQGLGLSLLALIVTLSTLLAHFEKAPLALLLLAPVYCLIALLASKRTWQKLLGELWRAPKDFSG
ncbi:hypothetical protein [Armatimonas sp.]|uniref:hypothetical protein n=1 Tax=Armatimonas sp. TaxID=1872638 RepID=UPI00286AEE2E|nr:hypothetical protein [Armatimonas sp.]